MHSKANTNVHSFGDDHTVQGPLVSVGIPTFNRASLLDKRLRNVLSQTYRHLEVIISDNASPDLDVQAVIQRWSAIDSRVRPYRQEANIGAHGNFLFVLKKATGPYFLWASDDDDWDSDFVACSVAEIGNSQLVMPRMATHFMTTGLVQDVPIPVLGPNLSKFDNGVQFLTNMQPGIIYGLHKLENLRRAMPDKAFDLADALMVYRAVLDKGVMTITQSQYRAGVPEDVYNIKISGRPGSVDKLSYRSFLFGCVQATITAKGLSPLEKLRLLVIVAKKTISVVHHLTRTYPQVARPQHILLCRALAIAEAIKNALRHIFRYR